MGTCFSYGNRLLQKEVSKLNSVNKIALIGSGTMGIGIAIDILNKTNYEIVFIDVADKSLKRAKSEIKDYFSGMVAGGRILENHLNDYLNKVSYTKDFKVLKDAEIVWEVATERIDIKKSIFENIEKYVEFVGRVPYNLICDYFHQTNLYISPVPEDGVSSSLLEDRSDNHGPVSPGSHKSRPDLSWSPGN